MQPYRIYVLIALFVVSSRSHTAAETLRLDYEAFTIWLDCARRGAVKFRYNAQRDQGTLPRLPTFTRDPTVPPPCQQTSAAPYRHPPQRYDRGHLVPANHLDYSATALRQSQYMTNILPQAANMNRGAKIAGSFSVMGIQTGGYGGRVPMDMSTRRKSVPKA
jgi:endonuclease G